MSSVLTQAEQARLTALQSEAERRASSKLANYFPETGPCARAHYPKQLDFFALGKTTSQRLFMAANRVGKSEAGAYETTLHLTGQYPDWWMGRRFRAPIEAWCVGTNSQTTRDIVQQKLLGRVQDIGSGMIPAHLIVRTIASRGLPGALEGAVVRHVSGGESVLGLKTYEQGRQSFEGTAKHVIWCDEEPPADCYTEMLYRTLTTKGMIFTTFTPLQGMSEVVKGFLEPETEDADGVKGYIQAGWQDVPHLDPDMQNAMRSTTPPYQIAARTAGEPALGSGAIYPMAEREILVPTAKVPSSWPKVYAMDVGWNKTAVVWAAQNPGNGQIVLYDEHYMGHGEPASHAAAIQARGDWMHGVIDPAAAGSSQADGRALIDIYGRLGLKLDPATNTVEAGLMDTWNLLVSGRLKVQEHLQNWRSEFRRYHRDEQGKIVKSGDHLMDATRYLIMSGRSLMRVPPVLRAPLRPRSASDADWMSA
jgi:phage terminase large subunit-like protein